MAFAIKKDWVTVAGYRAVVIMIEGHHCGYVGLPTTHPLFGKDYRDVCDCLTVPEGESIGKRGILAVLYSQGKPCPDLVFDVHGSITYADTFNTVIPANGLWWFGFDCNHAGDAKSSEYYEENPSYTRHQNCVFRDLDYCVAECESLAAQMNSRVFASYQQTLLPAPNHD